MGARANAPASPPVPRYDASSLAAKRADETTRDRGKEQQDDEGGQLPPAPARADRFHKPYRCIQAVGAQPSRQRGGLLTSAAKMLLSPVRDAVGFQRQRHCPAMARLSQIEKDCGVWSDWVTNYTCAGLKMSLESSRHASVHRPGGPRQALVLTAER